MEKRIPFFHFQSVKAVAKAIDPHLRTIESIKKKVMDTKKEYEEKQAELKAKYDVKFAKFKEEFDASETQINALEAGILQVIGFHVSDLVKKVIEPTGKVDPKTNKPIKVTNYVPTDIVTYDDNTKEFVVSTPDDGANTVSVSNEEPSTVTEAQVERVPTTEDVAGSDFDADAEAAEVEAPTADDNDLPFM